MVVIMTIALDYYQVMNSIVIVRLVLLFCGS